MMILKYLTVSFIIMITCPQALNIHHHNVIISEVQITMDITKAKTYKCLVMLKKYIYTHFENVFIKVEAMVIKKNSYTTEENDLVTFTMLSN